jgi:hypothetical protein
MYIKPVEGVCVCGCDGECGKKERSCKALTTSVRSWSIVPKADTSFSNSPAPPSLRSWFASSLEDDDNDDDGDGEDGRSHREYLRPPQ